LNKSKPRLECLRRKLRVTSAITAVAVVAAPQAVVLALPAVVVRAQAVLAGHRRAVAEPQQEAEHPDQAEPQVAEGLEVVSAVAIRAEMPDQEAELLAVLPATRQVARPMVVLARAVDRVGRVRPALMLRVWVRHRVRSAATIPAPARVQVAVRVLLGRQAWGRLLRTLLPLPLPRKQDWVALAIRQVTSVGLTRHSRTRQVLGLIRQRQQPQAYSVPYCRPRQILLLEDWEPSWVR